MKNFVPIFFLLFLCGTALAGPAVYVDPQGTMRYTADNSEASFYGVNYTAAFAHAYRALQRAGVDHKTAIDRDAYHFARLGFNAYRIHIWDVEISDGEGDLIENDHLDLLDYLIYRVSGRGMSVMITAMTNFGNGYPERNEPTGGFSYLYDKCKVHEDPAAIRAQQRYVDALLRHVNPYTGTAWKDDPVIVGFEINNEPCHSASPEQTAEYIAAMVGTIRATGTEKPIFYNASHNMDHVGAYLSSDVQGLTFQWYPTGLVSGHKRQGNFLPSVDRYDIPFGTQPGFADKALMVYEFDPADITYSYMYPAMTRAFRTAGFGWITQFAYDPIDIAPVNTEYQTHFLNLAYTPGKALSMKIAAQAAYRLPRGKDFGIYPANTTFGPFTVDYGRDLSVMNTPEKFFYSNNTDIAPVAASRLAEVAGCGSSPVVTYPGTGAYMLDKLEAGVWRLEIMPDAVETGDPFAKVSPSREVVRVVYGAWPMKIALPDLGLDYTVKHISSGAESKATKGEFTAAPGVYILTRHGLKPKTKWTASSRLGHIALGEFVAPAPTGKPASLGHTPAAVGEKDRPMTLQARVAADVTPDSVILYPAHASMWGRGVQHVKMERTQGPDYAAVIPAGMLSGGNFSYTIVICSGTDRRTFPGGTQGSPVDWDFCGGNYYRVPLAASPSPVILMEAAEDAARIETGTPCGRGWLKQDALRETPTEALRLRCTFTESGQEYYIRKYVGDIIAARADRAAKATTLCLWIPAAQDAGQLYAGVVTSGGTTYRTPVEASAQVIRIPLSTLSKDRTAIIPAAYPVFLPCYFQAPGASAADPSAIEFVELSTGPQTEKEGWLEIGAVWLE